MTKTILNSEATKPLGYIKRLPISYAPNFYRKVSDLLVDINNPIVEGYAASFREEVRVMNEMLIAFPPISHEELVALYRRTEKMWKSFRQVMIGYTLHRDEAVASMARRALTIYDNIRKEKMLRTNAAELLNRFVIDVEDIFTSDELQSSFLGEWVDLLSTTADEYSAAFLQCVDWQSHREFFTNARRRIHRRFEMLYFSLFVASAEDNDEALTVLFGNINELLAIFTQIAKSHATRLYNLGHGNDDESVAS